MGDYQVPEIKLIDKLTQNDLNPLLDIFCLCAKYEGVKLALPIKNVNVFEQKLQLFPKHSLSNMPDSIYEGRYIDTNEQKISIIKNQYIKAFAALHKIEDINKLTPNLLYSLYRVLNAPESQTKSATPLNKIHRYYTQLNDEGDELELLDKSKIPAKLEELCTYLKLNWDKSSKQMKLFRICVFIMNFSILQPFQNGNDMIANLLLDWLLSLIDIPCARYGYIELFSEAFRKLYSDCLWANRVYGTISVKELPYKLVRAFLQQIRIACERICNDAISNRNFVLHERQSECIAAVFSFYPRFPLGKTDIAKLLKPVCPVADSTIKYTLKNLSFGNTALITKIGSGPTTKYRLAERGVRISATG